MVDRVQAVIDALANIVDLAHLLGRKGGELNTAEIAAFVELIDYDTRLL